jgi:hypothetical protein
MLSWILLILLTVWMLRNRVGQGKIDPNTGLGMPEGTIRAFLAIVIVSLPFTFFWRNEPVPSIVSNMVFATIAFYFEKRIEKTSVKEAVMQISEERKKLTRNVLPLYVPKYTVRALLVLLVVVLFINSIFVTSPFPAVTNTFIDILAVFGSFVLGILGRAIEVSAAKHKILKVTEKTGKSLQQVTQELEKESRVQAKRIGALAAYLVCAALVIVMVLYTVDIPIEIPIAAGLSFPLREAIFMFVNFYFGFRQ